MERSSSKVVIETMPLTASTSLSFRSNVLKLNIFYEELNYELIREERSYEVGGHLLRGKIIFVTYYCVTLQKMAPQ